MTEEQDKVKKFHEAFELDISGYPKIPESDVCELRVRLIQEELDELKEAFEKKNLVDVADAIGDLLYVVLGAGVTTGIDLKPVFDEVHRSNMTKVGGHKREDGKWMKPLTWEPPNLFDVLLRQVSDYVPET